MINLMLPAFTFSEIEQKLKLKKLENITHIALLEKMLTKERGYVFRMPRPGSSVILLLSGGLDTIVISDILMRKYKLQVFPLFLRRGQRRVKNEERSIDYFSRYYKQMYPTLFHSVQKINVYIPPKELRWSITAVADEPVKTNSHQLKGIPLYSNILFSYAVQYAHFLHIEKKIFSRSIFCGFVSSDGNGMAYETLTALRSITLSTCVASNDFSWQLTSIPLEKQLGFYWGKEVLISWANRYHIPIKLTWSCYWAGQFHCGDCIGCKTRKNGYAAANIKDPTYYWSESPFKKSRKWINIHDLSRKLLSR